MSGRGRGRGRPPKARASDVAAAQPMTPGSSRGSSRSSSPQRIPLAEDANPAATVAREQESAQDKYANELLASVGGDVSKLDGEIERRTRQAEIALAVKQNDVLGAQVMERLKPAENPDGTSTHQAVPAGLAEALMRETPPPPRAEPRFEPPAMVQSKGTRFRGGSAPGQMGDEKERAELIGKYSTDSAIYAGSLKNLNYRVLSLAELDNCGVEQLRGLVKDLGSRVQLANYARPAIAALLTQGANLLTLFAEKNQRSIFSRPVNLSERLQEAVFKEGAFDPEILEFMAEHKALFEWGYKTRALFKLGMIVQDVIQKNTVSQHLQNRSSPQYQAANAFAAQQAKDL